MNLPEFRNEPASDFKGNPEHCRKMTEALKNVAKELGRDYNLVIGSERIKTQDKLISLNPAHGGRTVGVFSKATPELADRALRAAEAAFGAWSRAPVEQRVKLLVDTARFIRERKYYYAAWMVYEVGKTWPEADADVAEAIDFAEFYAREMLRLSTPRPLIPAAGEKNVLQYIPLGPGVVIPPWNFPLAITTGMTLASIVTGNTVVLKPSSDSPAVAYKLFEALEHSGMPPGVVNFLPGPGSTLGDYLVAHPRTRFIAFTGSKDVGLRINELAARRAPGQIWIKRTVLEMGGKNSIVIDTETDLDLAVEGVALSAFGFQGQKCSACSRAIVVDAVYDAFLSKLNERIRKIHVGDPQDPENDMGPVINARAKKAILDYIEIGKKEGRLIAGGKEASEAGHFLEPTVIADVPPKARIAQEEIFGPVLAVIKAANFEEALGIANNTEYGLTGAVYTQNRRKLERAAEEFHVGNLYFNRKCTGALVGGHPFGGFNMSGTDSKAGGFDYLLLFTQAKTIAEKRSLPDPLSAARSGSAKTLPQKTGGKDAPGPRGRLKAELKQLEVESRAVRALLIVVAALLAFGAISILLPRGMWHHSALVLWIPPQVLFVVMLVIMGLALYLVRYESEARKLRLLTLQQAQAAQSDYAVRALDAVTNVFTRNFLYSLLEGEIARAERNNQPLALMMCDVNNFKRVNDRYGHLMGDEVLAQIAAILKSCLRGSDHVVRYGGDEFLLILPETDETGALIVRDRIIQRVTAWDLAHRVGDVSVSLSLGLYHHLPGQSAEKDVAEVDAWMYAEKRP